MKLHSVLRSVLMLSAATLMVGAVIPAQAGALLDKVRSSKTLVIGYRPDSIPFSYKLSNGEVTGYSIEICQKLAGVIEKELGVELTLKYVPVLSSTRMQAIQQRQIDLECASTINTKQRREQFGVAFLSPHFITGTRILSRADAHIETEKNLQGKKLIYPANTTAAAVVDKYKTIWGFQPQVCGPTFSDCMKVLSAGQADGWIMLDIILQSHRATSNQPNKYQLVGKMLSIEHQAIMYRADDAEWGKLLNAAMLKVMPTEGHKLYHKWFQSPIPQYNINIGLRASPLLMRYFRHPSPEISEYQLF